MKDIRHITTFVLAFLVTGLFSSVVYGQNKTPDNWKCTEGVSGEWAFGRAPRACRVNVFQNENDVNTYWKAIIFQDSKSRSEERVRYMSEMNKFITGMSSSYLQRRKPNVSEAEKNAWAKAVLALVHQESFWSHYRVPTDNKLRMMRGDYGHGHGLMQVDDRWHFVQVNTGGAARVQDNIIYALDMIYKEWERAASASCVGSPSNYVSRTRAMYSAYNGGPSKLCRWTNPKDKWARNDINYYDKFKATSWAKYIDNRKTYEYNFNCLAQGGGLKCFDSAGHETPTTPNPTQPTVPTSPDVVKIGGFVEATVNVNLRKTPGGDLVSVINKGQIYQVLDVYINPTSKIRYYLVSNGSHTGYVHGGTNADYDKYLIPSDRKTAKMYLANISDRIVVKASEGINLRTTAAGDLITRVPNGERLDVQARVIRGSDRDVYYKVEYRKQTGYIYSGRLAPTPTTQVWTEVE